MISELFTNAVTQVPALAICAWVIISQTQTMARILRGHDAALERIATEMSKNTGILGELKGAVERQHGRGV